MFCDIKTFKKKLEVFKRDLNSGQLQYFSNLKLHIKNLATFANKPTSCQENYKEFSSIVLTAKKNFAADTCNRFPQFHKLEKTLQFLTFTDKAGCEEIDLSCLRCLDFANLEMELLEFQKSSIWKNKFYELRETLKKLEGTTKDIVLSSENEILKV